MKTHSELKIYKSNGYNYIYLYYKQNKSFVRINTKLYAIENQMTVLTPYNLDTFFNRI